MISIFKNLSFENSIFFFDSFKWVTSSVTRIGKYGHPLMFSKIHCLIIPTNIRFISKILYLIFIMLICSRIIYTSKSLIIFFIQLQNSVKKYHHHGSGEFRRPGAPPLRQTFPSVNFESSFKFFVLSIS